MKSKKAFVFSLDAFIAFTLSLAAIYSLIFFSSIPSAYYSSLTQAHFLARDALLALSTASPPLIVGKGPGGQMISFSLCEESSTALDCVLLSRENAKAILDPLIPKQFGYTLSSNGNEIYSTANDLTTDHNKYYQKLKASAEMLYFGESPKRNSGSSPYCYKTCHGSKEALITTTIEVFNPITKETYTITQTNCPTPCDPPASTFKAGELTISVVRLTIFI